jgi:uncharacterized protein
VAQGERVRPPTDAANGVAPERQPGRWDRRRIVALVAPVGLITSTYVVFQAAVGSLGQRWGYLAGFVFFWVVWCLALPLGLLGWRGVRRLFRSTTPRLPPPGWLWAGLLAVPVVGGFATVLVPALARVTIAALALAVGIAVVNATCEEILWRGVYAELFAGRWIAGWLYPAVAFTLWHISPAAATGGRPGAFWFGVGFIGLVFGWVAYRTASIRWTTFAHILVNAMGPGFAMLLLYGA